MSQVEQGRKVLLKAEQSLQSLVADAATAGDYEALAVLAGWAQRIGAIADLDQKPKLGGATRIASSQRQPVKPPKRSSKKKKGAAAAYPKFVRDGDYLVKIGWSKRERSEYEHKALESVVRAVAASISRAGVRGNRFTMDTVLPLKNLDGSPIPDYQSYMVLAWLRWSGLITQHGRLGYTVPENLDLGDAVEDCWNRLDNRSPIEHGSSSQDA